ncbi:hypothetical protein [Defluviicoccus vanus]|uniref:Uncharacterized protein n=1 Tax=Defluviicoccus vanus TaxID=111831 RepID=A0A7H1N3J9_9PROT|nr:hypothetical protein [Defluviicoccus vanus]QNT70285.1 hypothetical protein HQ394_14295 [Defluviicoccus vanus]
MRRKRDEDIWADRPLLEVPMVETIRTDYACSIAAPGDATSSVTGSQPRRRATAIS